MIDLKLILLFLVDIKTSHIGVGLISLDERVGTPYLEKGEHRFCFCSTLISLFSCPVGWGGQMHLCRGV